MEHGNAVSLAVLSRLRSEGKTPREIKAAKLELKARHQSYPLLEHVRILFYIYICAA